MPVKVAEEQEQTRDVRGEGGETRSVLAYIDSVSLFETQQGRAEQGNGGNRNLWW